MGFVSARWWLRRLLFLVSLPDSDPSWAAVAGGAGFPFRACLDVRVCGLLVGGGGTITADSSKARQSASSFPAAVR